ncbi:BolA family transcriptional regulator [Buchnera aphidicola (Aphis fabae)]|uniref:BolA family transcriptional regulator n=1 Tax=Buchnera aphidicola (Aphis fabae) TaxID=571430 RepID=A0A5J6ZAY7_9GAMM|nr:BolA family protein [Buchnera aphidicola]QFQ32552.1 BolA family transcriptional regulator [Buchnera aphidicola (Aphis fabae)]
MNNEKIISILNKKLNLEKIYVTGDNNHIKIIAVGDIFKGINEVKRQQIIYAPLIDKIIENKIHALSIKTYTKEEWKKNNKNNKNNLS